MSGHMKPGSGYSLKKSGLKNRPNIDGIMESEPPIYRFLLHGHWNIQQQYTHCCSCWNCGKLHRGAAAGFSTIFWLFFVSKTKLYHASLLCSCVQKWQRCWRSGFHDLYLRTRRTQPFILGCVWKCRVPLNPMVFMIIIPIKWLLLGICPIFRQTHLWNSAVASSTSDGSCLHLKNLNKNA